MPSRKKKSRIVDRDGHFMQSRGTFDVRRIGTSTALLMDDFYHTLVNSRLYVSIILAIFIYNFVICIYAVCFMHVAKKCNIDTKSFMDAYYFSLETIMTIGFGTKDRYFGGCWEGAFLIMFEAMTGVFLDAVFFGLIYQRVSRGSKRAATMIFSDKAIIREIRGHLYFMFQVVEMRDVGQMIEGHVRAYAVRHLHDSNTGKTTYFQSHSMRLQHPDDEIGGMLLLSLPSVVVHRIDAWSPLLPPARQASDQNHGPEHDPSSIYRWPDVLQREADVESGNRERVGSISNDLKSGSRATAGMRQSVADFINNSSLEVVTIVEGICNTTSDSLQCRHSYTVDDIVWDHEFSPCVSKRSDGGAQIDFAAFHKIEPILRGVAAKSDGLNKLNASVGAEERLAEEAAAQRCGGESGFNVFEVNDIPSHA
jgi:hypothetical protein